MSGSGKTKTARNLTTKVILALTPEEDAYRVPDQKCRGLAIRIASSGLKTWDLAYRIRGTGKVKRLSLGSFIDVELHTARERANEITKAARLGRDLISEEKECAKAAAARITVEQLIDEYLLRRVEGRLRSARDIGRRLKRALVTVLDRPVEELKRRDIRALLNEVADRGLKREAERRRQVVGAMCRWAVSQDLLEMDPTAGLMAYDPGTLRDRILSDEEIRDLWTGLVSAKFPEATAEALRVQLALGARCGEVGGMRAEEIDQQNWLWTLPAERSKNKRSRVTPLVGRARDIIERRLKNISSGYLFQTESGGPLTASHVGHKLMNRRQKMQMAHFSTHDIRRTCATRFVEMGFPLNLVAAAIGHEVSGGQTRTLIRHYVRTDLIEQKRRLFEAWDRVLEVIVTGGPRGPASDAVASLDDFRSRAA